MLSRTCTAGESADRMRTDATENTPDDRTRHTRRRVCTDVILERIRSVGCWPRSSIRTTPPDPSCRKRSCAASLPTPSAASARVVAHERSMATDILPTQIKRNSENNSRADKLRTESTSKRRSLRSITNHYFIGFCFLKQKRENN